MVKLTKEYQVSKLQNDHEKHLKALKAGMNALRPQARPYLESAIDIANLVEEKQLAYGDSFGKAGKIMEILYPDGIFFDNMDDALTVVRILDKLFRIATKKKAFGESPWKDIMGYALLATVRDGRTEGK